METKRIERLVKISQNNWTPLHQTANKIQRFLLSVTGRTIQTLFPRLHQYISFIIRYPWYMYVAHKYWFSLHNKHVEKGVLHWNCNTERTNLWYSLTKAQTIWENPTGIEPSLLPNLLLLLGTCSQYQRVVSDVMLNLQRKCPLKWF